MAEDQARKEAQAKKEEAARKAELARQEELAAQAAAERAAELERQAELARQKELAKQVKFVFSSFMVQFFFINFNKSYVRRLKSREPASKKKNASARKNNDG